MCIPHRMGTVHIPNCKGAGLYPQLVRGNPYSRLEESRSTSEN